MGTTTKYFIVKKAREANKKIEVEFLIDSGAVYSLVPEEQLKILGIKSYRKVDFSIVDGTKITRKVDDAYFEYYGVGGDAPVIFGENGDKPLLSVTTLESIGLVLNSFKRELYPMRMLLV